MSDTPHAVPFYCPFCGEQDLVPAEPAQLEWVGGEFDPEAFDIEAVNEELR